MDPTIPLCQIVDSFLESDNGDPTILHPDPFKLSRPRDFTIVSQIETASIEDIPNLDPSDLLVDINSYQYLLKLKSQFDEFDVVSYRNLDFVENPNSSLHKLFGQEPRLNQEPLHIGFQPMGLEPIRQIINPFEKIGNSVFMNEDSIQMANIDAVFNITNRKGGLLAPQEIYVKPNIFYQLISTSETIPTDASEPIGFTFCDIESAPGGFTQYIQYRYPLSFGWGMSSRSGPKWNIEALDINETNKTINGINPKINSRSNPDYNFNIVWGSDATGNIYNNADWLSREVRKYEIEGVNLVMAGGRLETEFSDPSRQEFLSVRLILNELLAAIQTLKINGSFVCKIFETVTPLMAELLFIMACVFEEFNVFKPMSTHPTSNERYVICRYLRKNKIGQTVEILRRASDAYRRNINVVKLLKDGTLTGRFVNYLKNINDIIIRQQIYFTEKIISYMNGQDIIIPEYNLSRALLYWNIPDNRENYNPHTTNPNSNPTHNPHKGSNLLSLNPQSPLLSLRPQSPTLSLNPQSYDLSESGMILGPLSPGRSPSSPPPKIIGSLSNLSDNRKFNTKDVIYQGRVESITQSPIMSRYNPQFQTYMSRDDFAKTQNKSGSWSPSYKIPILGSPGPISDVKDVKDVKGIEEIKDFNVGTVMNPSDRQQLLDSEQQKIDGGRELTYLNLSDKLNPNILGNILQRNNSETLATGQQTWHNVTIEDAISNRYVDMIVSLDETLPDDELYNVVSTLNGLMETSLITNKVNLHDILIKNDRGYIPETIIIDSETEIYNDMNSDLVRKIDEGGVWIWRPEYGYGGKGIRILNNPHQLSNTILSFYENPRNIGSRGLVSKYIVDPMLIDGYKFHLRIYLLIVINDTGISSYVMNDGEIFMAVEEYTFSNFYNKNIHNTHEFSRNAHQYLKFYPRDYPLYPRHSPLNVENVNTQIKEILTDVIELTSPSFHCISSQLQDYQDLQKYENTGNCYKLLGCDFMIDSNGKVFLLEINSNLGLPPPEINQDLDYVSNLIFESIYDAAIGPTFDPNYTQKLNVITPL